MICETCGGIGKVEPKQKLKDCTVLVQPGFVRPCPECGGCGITHCCDGLTACNDPKENEDE